MLERTLDKNSTAAMTSIFEPQRRRINEVNNKVSELWYDWESLVCREQKRVHSNMSPSRISLLCHDESRPRMKWLRPWVILVQSITLFEKLSISFEWNGKFLQMRPNTSCIIAKLWLFPALWKRITRSISKIRSDDDSFH